MFIVFAGLRRRAFKCVCWKKSFLRSVRATNKASHKSVDGRFIGSCVINRKRSGNCTIGVFCGEEDGRG
jgi:hypothetical protein